ncbi:MAG TPA: hypothetical protein VLZ81_05800 [Blastocatellia bacterium]|nr:hypothetical protein [Blastocatellia bacterium]
MLSLAAGRFTELLLSRVALEKEDWVVLLFLLIAVLFGVLILAFVIVLMRDKHHRKKCPFCAESVMLEAKICKHCGSRLVE